MRAATWCRWALVLSMLPAGAPVPASAPPTEGQLLLSKLNKQLDKALSAGRFAEAVKVARRIEAVWARARGADDWQTIDSRYDARRWQRLCKLSDKESREVGRALD